MILGQIPTTTSVDELKEMIAIKATGEIMAAIYAGTGTKSDAALAASIGVIKAQLLKK